MYYKIILILYFQLF